MFMRSHLFIFFSFLLFLPFTFLGAETETVPAIPVDGLAATVNGRVITAKQILTAMQPLTRQLEEKYKVEDLSVHLHKAYTNLLESWIERELILDSFEQLGGQIPEAQVDNHIDEIERVRFKSNRAVLYQTLASEGLTMQEWRDSIREDMIIAYMRRREIDQKVKISPQSMRESYESNLDVYSLPEQVDLSMIVLHQGKTAEESRVKLQQAESIRQRLLKGEDFALLAQEASEGIKASGGGHWGWINPATRRAELASAIAKLQVGEISPVIQTSDALYLLTLGGRRAAHLVPFEEVQVEIRADLQRQQEADIYEAWIKRLKRKAYIKRF